MKEETTPFLEINGAVISLAISSEKALKPVKILGLIDTGANVSLLDKEIVKDLGLAPIEGDLLNFRHLEDR